MSETDDQTDDKTDDCGVSAVHADARAGAGCTEVMCHGSADQHAEGKDAGVAVTFAGQKELASGAAARQSEGETGCHHAAEIPEAVSVRDGLSLEARVETAEDQIADERGGEHGCHAEEEVGVTEQEKVTEGAHGAETAALRQDADDQSEAERGQEGSVLGTGALEGVEDGTALGLPFNLREEEIEGEQAEHQQGENKTGQTALSCISAKGVALTEEKRAAENADKKTGKAEEGVAVAAGKAQDGAPGAAEKDQRAHGRHDAENEADQRGGTAAGLEFTGGKGSHQSSQDKAHDLGPQILNHSGAVQAESAGCVALKAGNADTHVAGVAELLQADGQCADHRADDNNARRSGKEIFGHTLSWYGCGFARTPGETEPCFLHDGKRGGRSSCVRADIRDLSTQGLDCRSHTDA